jgi:hypothetical protein
LPVALLESQISGKNYASGGCDDERHDRTIWPDLRETDDGADL